MSVCILIKGQMYVVTLQSCVMQMVILSPASPKNFSHYECEKLDIIGLFTQFSLVCGLNHFKHQEWMVGGYKRGGVEPPMQNKQNKPDAKQTRIHLSVFPGQFNRLTEGIDHSFFWVL